MLYRFNALIFMKSLTGIVTSTKMAKTAAVRVDHAWKHPLYLKSIRRSSQFLADNSLNAKEGDTVAIVETRPISKRKNWRIEKILK